MLVTAVLPHEAAYLAVFEADEYKVKYFQFATVSREDGRPAPATPLFFVAFPRH